jgi:site-specific recombinase XerD
MELNKAIAYFAEWSSHKYTSRTVEIYVMHLRRFVAFVGDKRIEAINLMDDIVAYKRHLEKGGLRDNTINLAMIALRQLWKALYCMERQLNIRLPFMADMIPIKKLVVARSHRPISVEQHAALMGAISSGFPQPFIQARDQAIFALLYDTGLRISELTSLNVSNLDMTRRSLEVVTKKRRDHFKKRESYWTVETGILLMRYLERRAELTTSDTLFINMIDRDRLNARSIQRNLKTYLKSAGLDPSGVSPHSFRHSVGKRAAEHQMYPPLLQALLGHRHPNSTQVYYNIQNEALRREYHTKLGDMRTEKVLAQLSKPTGKRMRSDMDRRGIGLRPRP